MIREVFLAVVLCRLILNLFNAAFVYCIVYIGTNGAVVMNCRTGR
jgi:hypothetical protein